MVVVTMIIHIVTNIEALLPSTGEQKLKEEIMFRHEFAGSDHLPVIRMLIKIIRNVKTMTLTVMIKNVIHIQSYQLLF